VNVVWGFSNAAAGYGLLAWVGEFHLRAAGDVAVAGLGALLISLFAARHFGRFHGGNAPSRV
jgi:hypothetical protein